jgi:hypothetical protein
MQKLSIQNKKKIKLNFYKIKFVKDKVASPHKYDTSFQDLLLHLLDYLCVHLCLTAHHFRSQGVFVLIEKEFFPLFYSFFGLKLKKLKLINEKNK